MRRRGWGRGVGGFEGWDVGQCGWAGKGEAMGETEKGEAGSVGEGVGGVAGGECMRWRAAQ